MGRKKRGRPSKSTKNTVSNSVLGGVFIILGLLLLIFMAFKNVGSIAQIVKIVFPVESIKCVLSPIIASDKLI